MGAPRVRAPRLRSDDKTPAVTSAELAAEHAFVLPPVLLMTPAYYGTLAAVRSFGRAAIPVTTAGTTAWNVSAFSKYAENSLICPATTDTQNLLAWLMEFGQTHERHALLATCDDTAWLYARHREALSQHFYLSSPDITAVHGLLHKGKLAEHARAVGLDTPASFLPVSEEDFGKIADQARFPLLVKPVTQALFPARSKGRVVEDAASLMIALRDLTALGHAADIVEYDPSSAWPMAQEFFVDASERIYNISGYVRGGKLCGARAGRKLLQRPRRLGVGVCFEEAPLDQALSAGLERLAARVGFNGVFEAEFVRTAGRDLLIDFNPRFYNQMGFDVARGLPLPLLAYHDAIQSAVSLKPPCQELRADEPTGKVFVHSSAFQVMVRAQRLSGALSEEEAAAFLAWYDAHRDEHVDAVKDPDDAWPGHIDRLQMMQHHLRHPRSFLRSIVMNR
jgi:predicted ATP-grasp superfamily ATP-dependent carboligase